METHFRPSGNSKERRLARLDRKAFSCAVAQNMNRQGGVEKIRPCSSHGDNHHRIRNRASSPLRVASSCHSKNQTGNGSAADYDELVKYMSNLPSYLEQGVKRQEKAFNVGVLDWSLLEKWQHRKQVQCRSDGSYSSNSNSSIFSTEESSTQRQICTSSSVAHRRHSHHVYQFKVKETSEGKSSHSLSSNQRGMHEVTGLKDDLALTTAFSKYVNLDRPDDSSCSKGKQHADSKVETRSRRSQSMSFSHKSGEKEQKAVHSRDHDDCFIEYICNGVKQGTDQKPSDENERSYNEISRKVYSSEDNSDVPHSLPLPNALDDQNIRVDRLCIMQEAKTTACSGHDIVQAVTDPRQGPRILKCTEDAAKVRNSSLSGRFRFGIGTTSKKPSSNWAPERMQDCSALTAPKPCAASIENSCRDKSASAIKARSSPLRRLLDPLLKARDGNNNCSSRPLDRDSKPVVRIPKTIDRPSTAPGGRADLSLSSVKSSSIHKPHYNEKVKESEVVQAILQVGFQNGRPLFTFAADCVKDILCAASSKLSTKKECQERYLYTLFSIHELKNKSWTNLRGKGNGKKCSPNVVAQIEVTESEVVSAVDHPSTGKYILREFVLTTVKLKPGEKTDSHYQLSDELAAVVVAIPGEVKDKLQRDKLKGTTVILPGGLHTLPSKGKPASLIKRWRSGGQCDCGGWDSGCKLRILNDSECASSSVKYELFDQVQRERGEAGEPVFNVAPLKGKEGVLSVCFSSSISPLQAFSICLAVLDTRKQSGLSNLEEARTSIRQMTGPSSYVSVPPDSPAERV